MNCKPGDLALIVKTGPYTRKLLGLLVTVTTRCNDILGNPAWYYKSETRLVRDDTLTTVDGLEDCCLKPIRGVPTGSKTKRKETI